MKKERKRMRKRERKKKMERKRKIMKTVAKALHGQRFPMPPY